MKGVQVAQFMRHSLEAVDNATISHAKHVDLHAIQTFCYCIDFNVEKQNNLPVWDRQTRLQRQHLLFQGAKHWRLVQF